MKHEYAHKLHNQYYAAIAHSALQTSNLTETFTQFCGRLVLTFGNHSKSGKISSQAAAIETTASTISEVSGEPKLLNSQQRQNKIDQQASKISSLVDTITKAVASNLNISVGNKPQKSETSGYTGKPYLGKPRPLKLALGIDRSLDPELSCQYCKDTSHLKENCVKLNRRLAFENRQPDWLPKKLEN